MGKRIYLFAVIIEIFGICLSSAGIAIEVVTSADIGYLTITAGSLCIAVGSMLFAKVAPWMRDKSRKAREGSN